MAIAELSAIFSTLQGVKDIAQGMIGLRDTALIQDKVIELQSAILDAQSAAFAEQEARTALVEKVGELEKEMARLKAWDTEKQRYELKPVGFGGSALVYQLKSEAEETEHPHNICTNCYEDGAKSILQGDRIKGDTFLFCPRCKMRLLTGGQGRSQR